MNPQSGLKHVATEPTQLGNKRDRRRAPSGRAAALRRAPSDSDCSGETGSLSADSAERAPRPLPSLERSGKNKSRRRGSEWEVLEGLKDGQRFEKRPEVFNGYLHKKRKWPLKGWHKRFFVIDGGILVYARSPTDVARGRLNGSVDVGLSVISAKQRRRRIDIDADEFIYHLRAKTQDVFRTWLLVLKAHRLYRQHLLTFGTREAAPKIHAADELPPTEGSTSYKKEISDLSSKNYYGWMQNVNLRYCKVDSDKMSTFKNGKMYNSSDYKPRKNLMKNYSMYLQNNSSAKFPPSLPSFTQVFMDKNNESKTQKINQVPLKNKSLFNTLTDKKYCGDDGKKHYTHNYISGDERKHQYTPKLISEHDRKTNYAPYYISGDERKTQYITKTKSYENKEFKYLTGLLDNHLKLNKSRLEPKQRHIRLKHKIEQQRQKLRVDLNNFAEREIAQILQPKSFEPPQTKQKKLKRKSTEPPKYKYKKNMQTYVMMFTNKKKQIVSANASQRSMKKSKKSTNVVKYKNMRFEPPLKNMTSKFILLNKYHIAPAASYHFRKVDLDRCNNKAEYDRITDKLVTTIFDVSKPNKTQDVAIIKSFVGRAVKELCEVRVNASHQVQQLFRNLLEFYLTSSATAMGKSVGSQIENQTRDAYLQISLAMQAKSTQTKPCKPIAEIHSLDNDELIQKLERTLNNTIYCCNISNTINSFIASRRIDKASNPIEVSSGIRFSDSAVQAGKSLKSLMSNRSMQTVTTTNPVASHRTDDDSSEKQMSERSIARSKKYIKRRCKINRPSSIPVPTVQYNLQTISRCPAATISNESSMDCNKNLQLSSRIPTAMSPEGSVKKLERKEVKRPVWQESDFRITSKDLIKRTESFTIHRNSVPVFNGLVSPTAAPIRGPQAGFVCGTPGGRLASWIIESGGPLENASKELGQAQLSVQQLQRLLDSLELQQQVHHDTDVSVEGASPNVKKDRRKFGLRKKKSTSKCASVELAPPHHIDPSNSHMAISALTAPPSPGGGASSVPNSAASLPIACAAARPQSLPGAEALGTAGGPASFSSLTPDHQLREDFTILAKDLVQNLKSIVGTLICERGRLRAAMDAADTTSSPSGAMVAALRTNLSTALQQNSDLRSRLSRIHDTSDLTETSSVGHNNADPVSRFQQSLSYSSSCVSASEFFDAEEHEDEKQPEIIEPDEAGVIELDGDSSSEVGSLSSEEGSASSDNSEVVTAGSATLRPATWTRRTRLPHPRPTPGGPSLWNLLYKNIGKDLSQVSMPVTINEPLNMLQRLCEELEYCELLDAASAARSPGERTALIAAFAVSAYAAAAHRPASKPFNPLLGETYECVRDDKGFRFIAEQVSHHPPVSACHADSPRWWFWQEARIKTKFWGKSMEFQPTGRVHVRLLPAGDHYSWNKVTTCVHNLFGGQRWVDQYGDMHITCHGTDISCKLQFIKASSWSTSRHEVRGVATVGGGGGGGSVRLQGRWSESLYAGEPPAARCLWRPGAMPPEHEEYYGFTRFAMELNEMEPGMRELLPNTDTRLRPDQRALEEGDVEAAEQYKHQLEQAQRDRRRDSPEHTPRWFRKSVEAGEEMWVSNGEYWKAREAGFSDDGIKLW